MRPLLLFTLMVCLSYSCQPPAAEESKQPPPDRNIGGLGLPRGLISKTENATPGYVYFNPLLSAVTYMINMDGEVVNQWKSEFGPSGWIYLLDNGNLMRGGRDPYAVFDGGGQGGWIEEFTWDGKLIWQYKMSSDEYLTHHDVDIMPNGNILAVAWEARSPEEAQALGRKPDLIPEAGLWPDWVVELKRNDDNTVEIVWEWHLWDHIIQDHDESLPNYGNPREHPELLDINLGSNPLPKPVTQEELDERRSRNNANTNDTPENQGSDIYHINSVNYNAELDQIILSSPDINEILVIDHSTTTEEAASHEGGRWGKGGDILYRWGNPQNYGRGDSTDVALGGQHDAKWIAPGMPGEGNVMVFNNFVMGPIGPYTSVLELTLPMTENGYEIDDDEPFGPSEPTWSYLAPDTLSFFAPFISGAHRMANGNTLITEGPKGRYFEVTPSKKVVWDYWTPYAGYSRMPDGTTPQPVGPFVYATFRATHIPADHPALEGKTLSPMEPQPEVYKTED